MSESLSENGESYKRFLERVAGRVAGAFHRYMEQEHGKTVDYNMEPEEWATLARFLAKNPHAAADFADMVKRVTPPEEEQKLYRIIESLNTRIGLEGMEFIVGDYTPGDKADILMCAYSPMERKTVRVYAWTYVLIPTQSWVVNGAKTVDMIALATKAWREAK